MTFRERFEEFKRFDDWLDDRQSPIFQKLIELEGRNTLRLREFIESLSYSNGILDPTQDYTEQLLKLRRAILSEYKNSELRDELVRYVDEIPLILQQHARSVSTVSNLIAGQVFNELVAEEIVDELVVQFSDDVFAKDLVQPMVDIYRRMLSGRTRLTTFFNELEEMGGRVGSYSKQIVRDSQRTLIGRANAEIMKEHSLDGFIYEGGLVDLSRPLCQHIVNLRRVIGMEEIRMWLKEEDYPDFQDGLQPNTTVNNFIQRVGGYGCRHKAQPVRLLNSDKEAINKYWKRELYPILN